MKTLRDGAVLLILLTLLVSVRVTPLEEAQGGGIIPEARASMVPLGPQADPQADPVVPARLLRAVGFGSAQFVGTETCPLRVKTLRTGNGNSHVIVIEVEEVEQADSPAPAATSVARANPTC